MMLFLCDSGLKSASTCLYIILATSRYLETFFLPGESVSHTARMAHDTEIPEKVPKVQLTFVTFLISIRPTPLNKTMGP